MGGSWAALGSLFGALGSLLGCSWGLLGVLGSLLGGSWVALGEPGAPDTHFCEGFRGRVRVRARGPGGGLDGPRGRPAGGNKGAPG